MERLKDDEMSSSSDGIVTAAGRSIKRIRFALGKGNKNDGKLIVVHKNSLVDYHGAPSKAGVRTISEKQAVSTFIRETMLVDEFLGNVPPKVIISVTGAAGSFVMPPDLEQTFYKGLVNAAKSTTAWITSGGTDVGIMHFVGEAIRQLAVDVPTIGFATYNKINNRMLLKEGGREIEYDATAAPAKDTVNLNANHSHFVLVESNENKWGEEIEARSDFEEFMCSTFRIPLCLIVVNGGPGTMKTVAEGAERGFPVVILEGSGRAADAIAREIRRKRGLEYSHLETMQLAQEQMNQLNTIVAHDSAVTLYTSKSGPLDFEILKAILSCAHGSLSSKLNLAVEWNRVDLANHLLDTQKDRPMTPDEFAEVLTAGLEAALELDRPELFRLLSTKGVRKGEIDLITLYTVHLGDGRTALDPSIAKYSPHLHGTNSAFLRERMLTYSASVSTSTPLLGSGLKAPPTGLTKSEFSLVKTLFKTVSPVFEKYAAGLEEKFTPDNAFRITGPPTEYGSIITKQGPDGAGGIDLSKSGGESKPLRSLDPSGAEQKVKYTDAMLWAILMGRVELAKAIWERTTLPVHSALVASGLCKGVSEWLLNEKQCFEEAAAWFEAVACKFLEKIEYDDAKILLTYEWEEFGLNALEIAVKTECKDFTANAFVQQYLDECLYRDRHGGIPLGTNFPKVIFCIIFPFFLYLTETYDNIVGDKINPRGRWYHFYSLPYTKFWTNTFCYIGYLVLLSVVLVAFQGGDVSAAEVILWIWMVAYALEEVSQWRAEGSAYLSYASNRMDVFIMVLQFFYIAFAIAGAALFADDQESTNISNASTDILIITTIISYIRLMDVFSISKDLGPLYFVMKKIVGDMVKWTFVFLLFAISCQVSFMALNNQIDGAPDMFTPTIEGGTFMGAFYTIVGDWDSTMSVLGQSWFAAVIVSLYALIAQIALVNLLIAMMGDTFESVKENSDKEWKYSRYDMIMEYTFASFDPPPFNIIVIPVKKLRILIKGEAATAPTPSVQLTKKQRDQFKNLMRNTKDTYLEESALEDLKTIGAVSDFARESLKLIREEQTTRFEVIDKKLNDMIKAGGAGVVGPNGGTLVNVAPAKSVDLTMDLNFMSEKINAAVKNEINQLQKNLLEAMAIKKPAESLNLVIQSRNVPLTWNEGIKMENVQKVVNDYKPFLEWVDGMNKPQNKTAMTVKGVHISSLDMFGPRIGFVKFDCHAVNEADQRIPGIIFMRGAAVGMLLIFKLNDPSSPEHDKLYTILTIQPRVPAGEARFAEIPAGMLDGGEFAGVAAKEIKEEVGLEIRSQDLIDLTGLAYNGDHKGVYPSAGGCDEFLRLFVYRDTVDRPTLESYMNKCTGEISEGERISLKVIPLDDLWKEAPDAKALSSLFLYESLMKRGLISREF